MNATNRRREASSLTITIPVHERKQYFEMALQSALNQTVRAPVIVLDNASTHDHFKRLCEQYGVPYYRSSKNEGLYGNWNRCAELSKTPWFLILADDDTIAPDYVEEFEAARSSAAFDFYFTNSVIDWGDKQTEWNCPTKYGLNPGAEIQRLAVKEGLGIPSMTGCYQTAMIQSQPWMTSPSGSNDWLWLYKNLAKMTVYGNEKRLHTYRKHPDQDSTGRFEYTYYLNYPAIYLETGKALLSAGGSSSDFADAVRKAEEVLKNFIASRGVLGVKALHNLPKSDPYRASVFDELKFHSRYVWGLTTFPFYHLYGRNRHSLKRAACRPFSAFKRTK